jgi:hypothetical protein
MGINNPPTAASIGAVPTSRQVIAGTNMTGGGALTGNVTLNSTGGGGGSVNVWDSTGINSGNAGAFGARGGSFTVVTPWTFRKLAARHTVEATATYRAYLVSLNGSNQITAILASSPVYAAGTNWPVTGTVQPNIYDFGANVTVPTGLLAIIFVRGVISGSAAWSMDGMGSAGILNQCNFQTVPNYARVAQNSIAVNDTLTVSSNPYWFGVQVVLP